MIHKSNDKTACTKTFVCLLFLNKNKIELSN